MVFFMVSILVTTEAPAPALIIERESFYRRGAEGALAK
jgi:hypothetical protein